jgi:hypothetical protein
MSKLVNQLDRISLFGESKSVNPQKFIIGAPLFFYFKAMFLYPWIEGEWSWVYVRETWDRWQALNAGVLALISSLIALNISSYNANKQTQREFMASKAFLPDALSRLTAYFRSCARVLESSWNNSSSNDPLIINPVIDPINFPELPDVYKSVFAECIKHAPPDVGDYLSKILVRLQLHDARLRRVFKPDNQVTRTLWTKYNFLEYIFGLGELQALTDLLFGFARGQSSFDNRNLVWDDFVNAYGSLDLSLSDFFIDEKFNLTAITKRRLSSNDLNPEVLS